MVIDVGDFQLLRLRPRLAKIGFDLPTPAHRLADRRDVRLERLAPKIKLLVAGDMGQLFPLLDRPPGEHVDRFDREEGIAVPPADNRIGRPEIVTLACGGR